ncbi:MAG TPA: hypothetical protein VFI20_05550 [Terracidiphilus sp.]|nr:hypothetical protein [Terracidiphilus sp.]
MDYAKIAAEARALQDATAHDAARRRKQEEASEAFFKAMEKCVYEEVDKANPELRRMNLLTGDRERGVEVSPKQFQAQCRLLFGRNTACEVNLDTTHALIDVEMTGEPDNKGEVKRHRIEFAVSTTEMGVVAHRIASGAMIAGPFGTRQVAEILVVGIIRGHFE